MGYTVREWNDRRVEYTSTLSCSHIQRNVLFEVTFMSFVLFPHLNDLGHFWEEPHKMLYIV